MSSYYGVVFSNSSDIFEGNLKLALTFRELTLLLQTAQCIAYHRSLK